MKKTIVLEIDATGADDSEIKEAIDFIGMHVYQAADKLFLGVVHGGKAKRFLGRKKFEGRC